MLSYYSISNVLSYRLLFQILLHFFYSFINYKHCNIPSQCIFFTIWRFFCLFFSFHLISCIANISIFYWYANHMYYIVLIQSRIILQNWNLFNKSFAYCRYFGRQYSKNTLSCFKQYAKNMFFETKCVKIELISKKLTLNLKSFITFVNQNFRWKLCFVQGEIAVSRYKIEAFYRITS